MKPFVNIPDKDGVPRLILLDDLSETFRHLHRPPPQLNFKESMFLLFVVVVAVATIAVVTNYLLEPCLA